MPTPDTPAARVCIFGAGAIGLDLATALLTTNRTSLAFIARNQTLTALRNHGLEAHTPTGAITHVPPDRYRCVEHPAELGEQDVIFLTIKSGATAAALPQLKPLLAPHTMVVTAMNGLPAWYASGRPAIERHLTDTHARDTLFSNLPRAQIIGAVVHRNATCPLPGVVHRNAGTGMVLGQLDTPSSERLTTLTQLLDDPAYTLSSTPDIHRELWHKLLINASFNPISVVCERSLSEMVSAPSIRARLRAIMDELHGLGVALEVTTPGSFDIDALFERFAAERRGAYTSMLLDYQRGRPLELDRIVRAPLWLAARPGLGYPMPQLQAALREVEAKAGVLATVRASVRL
ncbi:ketopantoate reductase family protein [Enhygromyxa salina]|uniref:2-dehydropantoate 2-reductase n=1 Tax=Enhygromyxa salina TaxID=215803 RepID=A0A2S9XQL7_9BACT|nr:2-dehydropantoate 2-reductase [Enhygromyxa salina]PRP95146.1 2-dehydropantoate 2-reductase [Enhygromyxa salina]